MAKIIITKDRQPTSTEFKALLEEMEILKDNLAAHKV